MSATDPAPSRADAMQRVCERAASAATGIAGAALLGLVAVQGWQVFARYVINDSPSWTEPVTLLLLAVAMSFGAAAGVHGRRHFSFHLLAEALPQAGRRATDIVRCAAMACVGAVLSYGSAVLLLDGLDVRMAGAPLPQSIVFLPLSVGGALMVLFAVEQLRQALRAAPDQGAG